VSCFVMEEASVQIKSNSHPLPPTKGAKPKFSLTCDDSASGE
jgi:hypothetical protein